MKIIALTILYKDDVNLPLAIVIARDEGKAKQLLARKRSIDWKKAEVLWAYEIAGAEREKILEHCA